MNIHPLCADFAEAVEATAQFSSRGFADFRDRTRERQIPCRMPDNRHIAAGERALDFVGLDVPRSCPGRLERKIYKLHSQVGHPLDVIGDAVFGMVHGSNQHLQTFPEESTSGLSLS